MLRLSLAEHCRNPQKSLAFANSSRNFLVWWFSGFSLLMRSDLFCTSRHGILPYSPMSVFSSMIFFHFRVSWTVGMSTAEQTITQPR